MYYYIMVLTKSDKLKVLNIKEGIDLTDKQVDILYDSLNNNNDPAKKPKTTGKIKKITKLKAQNNDPRYIVLLKFINIILTNLGKTNINDLLQFKDVDREDIIKQINKDSLVSMYNELFEYFSKLTCKYYRRDKIDNYILTFLRSTCSEIGFNFINKKKSISISDNNGVKMARSHYLYCIV